MKPLGTESFDDLPTARYEMLHNKRQGYCYVCTSTFQATVTVHNAFRGADLPTSVNLVLSEPPYNTPREQNHDNSAHDVFENHDMRQLAEVVQNVLERLVTWRYK